MDMNRSNTVTFTDNNLNLSRNNNGMFGQAQNNSSGLNTNNNNTGFNFNNNSLFNSNNNNTGLNTNNTLFNTNNNSGNNNNTFLTKTNTVSFGTNIGTNNYSNNNLNNFSNNQNYGNNNQSYGNNNYNYNQYSNHNSSFPTNNFNYNFNYNNNQNLLIRRAELNKNKNNNNNYKDIYNNDIFESESKNLWVEPLFSTRDLTLQNLNELALKNISDIKNYDTNWMLELKKQQEESINNLETCKKILKLNKEKLDNLNKKKDEINQIDFQSIKQIILKIENMKKNLLIENEDFKDMEKSNQNYLRDYLIDNLSFQNNDEKFWIEIILKYIRNSINKIDSKKKFLGENYSIGKFNENYEEYLMNISNLYKIVLSKTHDLEEKKYYK